MTTTTLDRSLHDPVLIAVANRVILLIGTRPALTRSNGNSPLLPQVVMQDVIAHVLLTMPNDGVDCIGVLANAEPRCFGAFLAAPPQLGIPFTFKEDILQVAKLLDHTERTWEFTLDFSYLQPTTPTPRLDEIRRQLGYPNTAAKELPYQLNTERYTELEATLKFIQAGNLAGAVIDLAHRIHKLERRAL